MKRDFIYFTKVKFFFKLIVSSRNIDSIFRYKLLETSEMFEIESTIFVLIVTSRVFDNRKQKIKWAILHDEIR